MEMYVYSCLNVGGWGLVCLRGWRCCAFARFFGGVWVRVRLFRNVKIANRGRCMCQKLMSWTLILGGVVRAGLHRDRVMVAF